MNIAQFVISIPLFMLLAFGIGFILNMLAKTTWLPILLYLGVVAYLFFFKTQGRFALVDWVILFAGLAGCVLSGIVIKTLRLRGFRMF
ncbi:MAG: hypothetical protein BAA01_06730 [Bacillus thermozeamaize]|uniref:Membrane protein YuiB n=1 Tax=Bacillus thermozeamaize TaxID=230954 RepID=A0A1Y3PMV8_9BACI|nr:MAG: hypothetical protein BAA01_06730 [Bacillus thermozeamaize]